MPKGSEKVKGSQGPSRGPDIGAAADVQVSLLRVGVRGDAPTW